MHAYNSGVAITLKTPRPGQWAEAVAVRTIER
jgi:hypothetical protein